MKTRLQNLFLVLASTGVLAMPLAAQTFTNLFTFSALDPNTHTNSDGAYPYAGLILSGNTLYGTAVAGGSSKYGTVFEVNTDGSRFTILHTFTFNGDGAKPYGGLILSGGILYGTAQSGGTGNGTVFALSTLFPAFAVLHTFNGSLGGFAGNDGAYPYGGLILSGNTLYGTTERGGAAGSGIVFAVDTGSTNLTILHNFAEGSGPPIYANSDGAESQSGLILSGNTLYGTANLGGPNGDGTVFAINTVNSNLAVLHTFTNSPDGNQPYSGMILSGNTLYGTTAYGGANGNGMVFAINTSGTGFTSLHDFAGYPNDGANPYAGLILSGNILYGTTINGGTNNSGMVFAVSTNGMGFTNLYSFSATSQDNYGNNTNSDGAKPFGGLILSGNTLYGTAFGGGSSGSGTVFSLSLVSISIPKLTILHAGANVVLAWPTNAAGFTLQSTTNLGSTTVWSTNLPSPVVISGQNTVTNPTTGKQQFYRLSQ